MALKAKESKKNFKTFLKNNLEIVVKCNMKKVNYLDVTLDLESGIYRPYRKPDNETNYIHVESNHPPNIIKEIPRSVQTRLSNLSSDENIFSQTTTYYKEALHKSGHNHEFQYSPGENKRRTKRKRKIIWFNPPYNKNLSTNIGKFFLNLINKHFPKEHKFHKIFNKNNVKVSYSCMPNIKSIIEHTTRIYYYQPT